MDLPWSNGIQTHWHHLVSIEPSKHQMNFHPTLKLLVASFLLIVLHVGQTNDIFINPHFQLQWTAVSSINLRHSSLWPPPNDKAIWRALACSCFRPKYVSQALGSTETSAERSLKFGLFPSSLPKCVCAASICPKKSLGAVETACIKTSTSDCADG